MAKKTNIISLAKYLQPAPVAKAASPKLTDVSFVKAKKEGRKRMCGLNYWVVEGTGNYTADCARGRTLALEYLQFLQRSVFPLPWIVGDMPKDKLTGIEIAFLSMVTSLAAHGAGAAGMTGLKAYVDFKNDSDQRAIKGGR